MSKFNTGTRSWTSDRLWMSARIAITLAVALAAVSCSHDVSRIQTRSLRDVNPTAWSFPLPVEEVHARALDAFSTEHQFDEPIFGKSTGKIELESVLSVETSTNAVFGKDFFNGPTNEHDIFLHAFHTPITASPVYLGRHGGLPFIAAFRLHLSGRGSNTVVDVTAYDTEVVNGTKFGFGPCGPGQGWNCVKVAPTTVEEYLILAYLGRHLGVTNMPGVILPAP